MVNGREFATILDLGRCGVDVEETLLAKFPEPSSTVYPHYSLNSKTLSFERLSVFRELITEPEATGDLNPLTRPLNKTV